MAIRLPEEEFDDVEMLLITKPNWNTAMKPGGILDSERR